MNDNLPTAKDNKKFAGNTQKKNIEQFASTTHPKDFCLHRLDIVKKNSKLITLKLLYRH
jgi:hypothetical protein